MTKEEILKEFQNIDGINEAKKIYKTLAKKLHPDMIGEDTKSFKILNEVYTDLIEHKIYFSNYIKIDIELEKVISLILHFENIVIELLRSWIWRSGDKKKIKKLGFKWASKRKTCYFGK
jgi:hypothetical protein